MVAAGYAVPACRGAALACPARRASRRAARRAAPVGATSGDASDSSDRVSTLQNEGAYAVLAKATALEREGRDIVHLEIGQPGFATPEHVVEAGVSAIRGGKTKYAAPDGDHSLHAFDVIKPIADIALEISKLKELTGRDAPTVIT